MIAQDVSKWTGEIAASYRLNNTENQKGFGALLSRSIKGAFWVQSGVVYKNQKEKFKTEIIIENTTIENDVELRLDYIRIPLMLMYNSKFLNLGLGTNYERFLGSKDQSNNPYSETSLSLKAKNKWYLTGYMGYPLPITNRIRIEPGMLFNYSSQRILTDTNLSLKYNF